MGEHALHELRHRRKRYVSTLCHMQRTWGGSQSGWSASGVVHLEVANWGCRPAWVCVPALTRRKPSHARNPSQELYSGAADCQIVVWTPERAAPTEHAPGPVAAPGNATLPPDQDAWSD